MDFWNILRKIFIMFSKSNDLSQSINFVDSNHEDDYYSSCDYEESSSKGRNYKSGRSSTKEHVVSGYTRHQNGKSIHVNSYKRGMREE